MKEHPPCICGHTFYGHHTAPADGDGFVPCNRVGCNCRNYFPGPETETGVKYDQGKASFALLPWDAVAEVAQVFTKGATKYAPRNWEKGLAYSRIFSSTQRHLTDWFQNRATFDPDGTGLRQIAQAAWGCLVLLAFELRGRTDLDDRPGGEP